ncbi:MAG: hypothetical protein AAF192_18125 [Pseudomonadota bacterium]
MIERLEDAAKSVGASVAVFLAALILGLAGVPGPFWSAVILAAVGGGGAYFPANKIDGWNVRHAARFLADAIADGEAEDAAALDLLPEDAA